jgi:hypothetical protein
MKLIFVLFVSFVFVNAFDFGEYNDPPEPVEGDQEIVTAQPPSTSSTYQTTTQAVADLTKGSAVTTTTTTTTAQPSTTTVPPPTRYTTAPNTTEQPSEDALSSSISSRTRLEIVVTRSMFRLMDEALRQRLVNFEARIASLLQKKEQTNEEIKTFELLTDEEFMSDVFTDDTRYDLKIILNFQCAYYNIFHYKTVLNL